MLNRLNKAKASRTSGAFSLVEILIVILIIAVLLAVAIPNLLSSRNSGTDAAAKQLLSRAQTEIQSYTLRTELAPADKTAAQAAVPSIQFVDGNTSPTLVTGTNARQVGYAATTGTGDFAIVTIGAKDGANQHCWGLKVSSAGNLFVGWVNGVTGACKASDVLALTAANTTSVNAYAFPATAA